MEKMENFLNHKNEQHNFPADATVRIVPNRFSNSQVMEKFIFRTIHLRILEKIF